MNDNRKSGIALIVGSIGAVMTMAIHPTGAATVSPDQVEHLVRMSGGAHALALVSALVLLLGTCGLTRILASPDRVAFSALVIFAFSVGALMIAAAISGWVIPELMKLMIRDAENNSTQWKIAIASIFQINQAMSRIYSVGAALAVTFWSASSLRQRRLSRGIGFFGCITAPLIATLIFVGHLRLDVHGMIVVMLSEVVWFTGMGVALLRESTPLSPRS
jgi:hypothetical protein